MTLETILRAEARFMSPLAGALRDAIVSAARELGALAPLPVHRRPEPTPEPRREFDPETADRYDAKGHFLPRWRRRHDDGQSLAEYALLLALIAIVAIVAVLFLGEQIKTLLQGIGESI